MDQSNHSIRFVSANCTSTFGTLHGNDGRKRVNSIECVDNFESHSSSHVPIQRRSHIAGGGVVCETLGMVSLSRAESVTSIILSSSPSPRPPREDIFPFRETNGNKCDLQTRRRCEMKFLLYYTRPCHIHFPFREATRSLRLCLSRTTRLKQYIDFSTPPRAGTAGRRVSYTFWRTFKSHGVGAPIVAGISCIPFAMINNFCMDAKEHAALRRERSLCRGLPRFAHI